MCLERVTPLLALTLSIDPRRAPPKAPVTMEEPRRDNIPMEVIEEMEKLFPGVQIVFAGQNPELVTPEMEDKLKKVEERYRESLIKGICVDCGKQHPRPWPLEILAKGWGTFSDNVTGDIVAIQCPECE